MSNLTVKQARFIEEYLVTRNAFESYKLAYDAGRMEPATVYTTAHRLLKHPKVGPIIEERLAAIGESMADETEMTIARALQSLINVVSADPDELTGLRVGCCRHCYGDQFQYQHREPEYLLAVRAAERDDKDLPDIAGGFGFNQTRPPLPDCPMCDGEGQTYSKPVDTSKLSVGARALFAGVKPTSNGPQVLMRDRDKASDSINKILGAYIERVKVEGVTANVDLTGMDATAAAKAYADMILGT